MAIMAAKIMGVQRSKSLMLYYYIPRTGLLFSYCILFSVAMVNKVKKLDSKVLKAKLV